MQTFEGVQGGKYHLVQTIEDLKEAISLLKTRRYLAVDTETSSLNFVTGAIAGIVLGGGTEANYYVPYRHVTSESQLTLEEIRPLLNELFLDESKWVLTWNGKFDLLYLRKDGFEIAGPVIDVMTTYHLIDENVSHALKETSKIYIDKNADKWEASIKEWRQAEAKSRRSKFNQEVTDLAKIISEDIEITEEIGSKLPLLVMEGPEFDAKYGRTPESFNIEKEKKKQLKSAIKEYCVEKVKQTSAYTQNHLDDVTYDYIPLHLIAPYACADVHYTLLLFKRFYLTLCDHPSLKSVHDNEVELLRVFVDTEWDGIKIDRPYLEKLGPEFDQEAENLSKKIYNSVGYEFNIRSTDELAKALQDSGVRLFKLTDGSNEKVKAAKQAHENHRPFIKYSVNADVLNSLASQYSIAKDIVKYKETLKLLSTYVDNLLAVLDSNDYFHSSFRQNLVTGRSSAQLVQTIPAGNTSIRRAFITPSSEYNFVFADFSQIELRIIAHASQDPLLLKCYPFEGEGVDVHTLTTSQIVLNKPYNEVQRMLNDLSNHNDKNPTCGCNSCTAGYARKVAKVVNFSIIYMVSAPSLMEQISTPERPIDLFTCEQFIEGYLETYYGVQKLINDVTRQIKNDGYTRNEFGRLRRFPELKKHDVKKWQIEAAVRQAVNYVAQGTAADLFKTAVTRVNRLFKSKKAKSRMVNFVHDEIQFYMHKQEMDLLPLIKHEMEDFKFSVPIITEFAMSETDWASKKKIKVENV